MISRLSTKEILRAVIQGAVLGILLSFAFAAGYIYRDTIGKPQPSQTSFALLNETDALLAQNFLYPMPNEATRIHGAVKGLVASLNDPYTFYVEPQTAAVDATSLAGKFGGIGVEIGRGQNGQYVITRVYHDNPAEKAGIVEGDVIIAVDGKPVDSTASDDNALLAAIRGDVGTPVVVSIQRQDKRLDIRIVRAEVVVPSTFWKLADADKRIGYVQIARFTERTPEEVKQALQELAGQGALGYVLDLRGNGGGLVDSAVGVAGQFLNGGPVLYERSKSPDERLFSASTGGLALSEPLVVLVNANTASAAEIVAGALQDRKRAQLVGQKTYGKGSVQVILPLSDGSSIHVTTAEWLTPDHHPIQGAGLMPDDSTTPVQGEDHDLSVALQLLQSSLSGSK